MICKCGGHTFRQRAKNGGASLSWEQCGACGRCGQFSLAVRKHVVAQGEAARRAYQDERLMRRVAERVTQ